MTITERIKIGVRKRIKKFYRNFDARLRQERANSHACRLEQSALTKDEKRKIKSFWGEWGGKYWSFAFYKSFCGTLNVQYVPDDYYDFAEHVLNLRWAAFFLQHKCTLKYILPENNRPKAIVQKIDGHYVAEDNSEISEQEAIALLESRDVIIAKNALGPGGGKGVRRIVMGDNGKVSLQEILKWHDITFEEVVVQHPFMAQFNPDSVNTIRFVTLNINGQCSVLSAFIRMGSVGSFVDNLSGGNGVLVGLNQEGCVNEFGIDKHFQKKSNAPTGVPLKGLKVPDYNSLKSQIVSFHQRIPFANLIGWDVAIDTEGNPVVLEINLDSALVEAHQVFNGPIFGERLAEVMKYIEDRKPTLRHSYITY